MGYCPPIDLKLGWGDTTTMAETEPWRIKRQKRAEACLAEFLAGNPDYSVDDSQPAGRGGTNFITFGAFRDEPVVYKHFDFLPRKQQEETALRSYRATGLVPKLYPVASEEMLVMERFVGITLTEAEETLAQNQIEQLHYELGRALAHMVSIMPRVSSDGRNDLSAQRGFDYEFYCQACVGALLDHVTEQGAQILERHDVPEKELLEVSLASLRQNREALLSAPSFLQIDDFHSHNIIVEGPRLKGFIDLEMTRHGNEILLLAPAMVMNMKKPMLWTSLRRGYEDY